MKPINERPKTSGQEAQVVCVGFTPAASEADLGLGFRV